MDRRSREDERPPLDEAIGQYVLEQPLVRSARGRPDIAVPWIVLGMAVAVAGLVGGTPVVLLVLLVGLPTIFGARLLAPHLRWDRSSNPWNPLRLVLILGWAAGLLGVIVLVLSIDDGTGNPGTAGQIGLLVVFGIASCCSG